MGTLLETVTASDSAALEFTTGIDSTYSTYQFVINDLDTVSAAKLYVQFYVGGVLVTSGDYEYSGRDMASGSSQWVLYGTNTAFMVLTYQDLDTAAQINFSGNVWLPNPASTISYKNIIFDTSYGSGGAYIRGAGGGSLFTSQGTAVTGIKFYMDTGNIELGTIRMYGFNAT